MALFPLLRDLLGEPARTPESFARAVGPVERPLFSASIGPRRIPKTYPPLPPPHRPLPRSAPPATRLPRGASRSAPARRPER